MTDLFLIGAILIGVFIVIPAIVASFLRNVEAGTIRIVSWLHGGSVIYRGPGKSKEIPLLTTGTTISSKVINVDLDIMLCVLAQALLAALRARLPGYADVTPDVLQRRFLETPGQIITTPDAVTVRLDRRAYTPVLRQAALPDTPVPWWGNRTLRYEFA